MIEANIPVLQYHRTMLVDASPSLLEVLVPAMAAHVSVQYSIDTIRMSYNLTPHHPTPPHTTPHHPYTH
jgi:hypothetical protein